MPAPTDKGRFLQAGLAIGDKNVLRTVVQAIEAAEGNLVVVREALGVSEATLYRWLGQYPELRAAVDSFGSREERIVHARGQLMREEQEQKRPTRGKKRARKR